MKKTGGFTLIELLIVMAILGMLAALVGPALFGNLSKGQRTAAQTQISSIETALDNYRIAVGEYPKTLEGLVENDSGRDSWDGPYLRGGIPKDPWGNDYFYQPSDKDDESFVLMSYGEDGVPGGQDDDADIGD